MLIQALKAAGLPSDAICFLPGPGEIIGPSLVSHPDIDFISFTGSREVGLSINSLAAQNVLGQKSVKKVVSEMGGKNAIVVDNDADLDEAVIAIIKSAFSYSGQKCSAASRIIAVGTIYQRLVERLIGATGSLRAAHPRFMDSDIGPLIDQSAVERFRRYSEIARSTCKILYEHPGMPGPGYFVPPTIVGNVDPTSPIATNEIFAPILAVFQAKDLPEAFELVNESDYALTAGIFSRSPRNIAMAQRCLFAGNLYINRSITGAVVGRQPFGGNRLSGVGSKAGGPDYLVQFTNPIVISENTMRHGYAPSDGLARPDHGNKRQR